jgi:hypothetical protein
VEDGKIPSQLPNVLDNAMISLSRQQNVFAHSVTVISKAKYEMIFENHFLSKFSTSRGGDGRGGRILERRIVVC